MCFYDINLATDETRNFTDRKIAKRSHCARSAGEEKGRRGAGEKGATSRCQAILPNEANALGAPVPGTGSRFNVPEMQNEANVDACVARASPPAGSSTVSVLVPFSSTGGETPPQPAGEDACATRICETKPPSPLPLSHPMGEGVTQGTRMENYQTNPCARRRFKISGPKFKVRKLRNEPIPGGKGQR